VRRNRVKNLNREAVSVDVEETPDEFLVSMNLPGVTPDNLTVNVVGNNITVSGDLREEREVRGEDVPWVLHIRRFGAFEYLLILPVAVEPTGTSDFDEGLLKMILPKASRFVKPGAADAARAGPDH
jgi:HSP20 family protein